MATLQALIRARVTAGLLVVLPIWVTWLLVSFIFGLMRDSSQWLVEAYVSSRFGEPLRRVLNIDLARLTQELGHAPGPAELYEVLPPYLQWILALLSVALTVFILYAIGLFAANLIGRRIIDAVERLLENVPLVKTVYRACKQILAALTGEQTQSFQRVAIVPFPDKSMRAVGFVTNTFRDAVSGVEYSCVFIPTTPNPTTGFFEIIPRADITDVDWSVEEAFGAIMSGGILLPPRVVTVEPNRVLPPSAAQELGAGRGATAAAMPDAPMAEPQAVAGATRDAGAAPVSGRGRG